MVYLHMCDQEYMEQPAVSQWTQRKRPDDTFRPCYCSLVCKTIRGKLRLYLHITLEGRATSKMTDGTNGNLVLRHQYRKGNVGCDIGTQTIAWTSDQEVGFANLA